MGAIWYSCPIRLVPTYILPAKDIRLLVKFQPDSFKTEKLACVETDRQTDMARSTRLVMLSIYITLWGRKRLLQCVANFWLKSLYPQQGYNKNANTYINILIQSTRTTLSNTFHSNYFSRHTNTAKLFLKLKTKLQYPQIYSSHPFAIQLCRWQTNWPTNINKRFLYDSRNVIPLFAPHIYIYVQCTYIDIFASAQLVKSSQKMFLPNKQN